MNDTTNATLELTDGRRLTYADLGEPTGHPLLFLHPSPSCRLEAVALADRAARHGFRLIAPDRPGFGGSDPAPGRTLSRGADDLIQLADALQLPRLTLLGISAGCPYALACAHARPDRVERVGIVSCGGPFDIPGARKAMARTFRVVFFLARRLPWAMRFVFRQQLALARRDPSQYIETMLGSMSGPDREAMDALGDAERAKLVEILIEALRPGPDGAVQDMQIVGAPWDFRAQDIEVPVQLWHGEADTNSPVVMGRWVAEALPNCEAHILPNEGHLSLPLRHMDAILASLRAD